MVIEEPYRAAEEWLSRKGRAARNNAAWRQAVHIVQGLLDEAHREGGWRPPIPVARCSRGVYVTVLEGGILLEHRRGPGEPDDVQRFRTRQDGAELWRALSDHVRAGRALHLGIPRDLLPLATERPCA